MSLELYSLHSTPAEGEYIIQKFDTDYTCEGVYALSETTCMCPQGHKPKCRHREMLPWFLKHGHIGDGWFLEWQTRLWRKPINDISAASGEAVEHSLADDQVMGTSASAEVAMTAPPPGAEPSPEAAPPSPPEGPQSPLAAEAAPASPVEGGAPIVKRRRIG